MFDIDPLSCRQIYHKSTNCKNLCVPLKEKSDSGMVKFMYVGFARFFLDTENKKISNIIFKKFLHLQHKKLFASISLVFYFE